MPDSMSCGFDLILELSDTAVASLISLPEDMFLDVDESISFLGQTYAVEADIELLPSALSLAFLPATNEVRADVTFDLQITNHNLDALFPTVPLLADDEVALTGVHLRVTHPIVILRSDTREDCLGMDFRRGIAADHIEVDLGDQLGAVASPLVGTVAAGRVQALLQDEIRYLASPQPLPLSPGDDDPWTLEGGYVYIVDEHCMAVCLRTVSERPEQMSAPTQSHLNGHNAAVLVSNYWLLHDLACPAIASYFRMTEDIDTLFTFSAAEGVLNSPHRANHLLDQSLLDYVPSEALHGLQPDDVYDAVRTLVDNVSIRRLKIAVKEGYLSIEGHIRVEGSGMEANVIFEARAGVHMTPQGNIEVLPNVQRLEVHIKLKWWVVLFSTLAAVFSPMALIATACLSPLVAVLADRVVSAIAEALRGLERELEGPISYEVPPLPIRIDRIVLDDLAYRGELLVPEREPEEILAWITGKMEVGEVKGGGGDISSLGANITIMWATFLRSHEGAFRVETRGLRIPLVCHWTLDGAHLAGSGSVDIGGVQVGYQVNGRTCVLSLATGDSLRAYLCVDVTDAQGNTASACKLVQANGSEMSVGGSGIWLLQGPSVFEHMFRWTNQIVIPKPIVDTPSWNAVSYELSTALYEGMGLQVPPDMWLIEPVF